MAGVRETEHAAEGVPDHLCRVRADVGDAVHFDVCAVVDVPNSRRGERGRLQEARVCPSGPIGHRDSWW